MPNWKKLITSGSDATLNSLNATSALTASGLNYPSSDGTDGQVLLTDGNGVLTFSDNITYVRVKNVSGGTLTKGTPVHATGTSGNTPEVIPASASLASAMPANFVLAQNISTGAEGRAVLSGFLNGVDTNGFDAGDIIYVAPTGSYTITKPEGDGNLIQNVAIVGRVGVNGSLFVYGSGRSNDVPNLPVGKIWVGSSNYSVTSSIVTLDEDNSQAQITGSLTVTNSITGSNANLNSLNLSSVVNAGEDTDKFLVLDSSGNIDFRTGDNVLSDIGAASSAGAVDTTGTPADNQIAVFTDSNTLEGDANFTWDGSKIFLANGKHIQFTDQEGTFPTNKDSKFKWLLNNDSYEHFAFQPASDQIDVNFKITDNAQSTDRFVFWIDDYRGETYDAYPLYMDGNNFVVNYKQKYNSGTAYSNNVDFYIAASGSTAHTTNPVFKADVSAGNIGIGTNTPGEKLTVAGNISASGDINTQDKFVVKGSGELLRIENPTWATAGDHDILYNGWTSGVDDYVYLKAGGNSTSLHGIIAISDTGGFFVGNTNTETGGIDPNAFDRLDFRVDASGNVTASGDISSSGDVHLANLQFGDFTGDIYFGTDSTSNKLSYNEWKQSASGGTTINNTAGTINFDSKGNADTMVISGSNVGIGTASPSTVGGIAKMTIDVGSGTAAPISIVNSTTDGMYIRRYGDSGQYQLQTTVGAGNTGNLSLQSYGGNVGIGTTTPGEKLEVGGKLLVSHSDASDAYLLRLHQENNGSGVGIEFSDNSAGTQRGFLLHEHSDSNSYGGGASFHFRSTEDDLVLAVGNADSTHGRMVVWSAGNDAEVDYGFAQDVNTGMVRTSADNVSLVAGGVRGIGVGTTAVSLKYAGNTKLATATDGIDITGNLTITGTLTAEQYVTTTVSSSVIYQSGSTQFGDTIDDTHTFTGSLNLSGSAYLSDNTRLNFGSDNDLHIRHNGTNAFITNGVGDLTISNNADDKDVIFQSDDGTGGTTTYFLLDGSLKKTRFWQSTRHIDNVYATFGTSDDLQIYHDASNSYIDQNGTGDLLIKTSNGTSDIKLQSGSVDFLIIDSSQTAIRMKRLTKWDDNIKATFGDGGDLEFYHNGTNSVINNITNNLQIINNANDGDISFQSDDGSGGTAEYFRVDGGVQKVIFSSHSLHSDNVQLNLGDSDDLRFLHNGSDSYIQNFTGHLQIQNNATDGDILFRSDDGSGGLNTYMYLDGGVQRVKFTSHSVHLDGVAAMFGNGEDLQISHNGSSTSFNNYTGHFYITQQADDSDIIFRSDDGSGGVTEYFRLDGSFADGNYTYTTRPDGGVITLGDSRDLRLWHDPSTNNSYIRNYTNDLIIETVAAGQDIIFNSGSSEYFRLDGSARAITVSAAIGMYFNDGVAARFGTSGDLIVFHDASDSFISNGTGDLYIRNTTDNKDIIFESDDGSGGITEYFRLDGSAVNGSSVTGATVFPDASKIYLGTDKDMEIFHNGSQAYIENYTGEMNFTQHLNDGDMIFKSDNGSGGTTEYFRLDGGTEQNVFSKDILVTNALVSNQENTDVDTGTETIASIAHASYDAAFFDFVIKSGTNLRAGTVFATHDGTNVEFTETSTNDLGDTSDVTLSVDISGADLRLRATTTSDNWTVKSLVRGL